MAEVTLPRPLITRLLAHAQGSPELEVCGLIGANAQGAFHLYPIANAAAEPERLFTMAPQAQIDALRTMRERGEQLFAIYHSHPHAPATPSATDLREAAYPEALYLIVSLDTAGVLELRAYQLTEGQFVAVALQLDEEG